MLKDGIQGVELDFMRMVGFFWPYLYCNISVSVESARFTVLQRPSTASAIMNIDRYRSNEKCTETQYSTEAFKQAQARPQLQPQILLLFLSSFFAFPFCVVLPPSSLSSLVQQLRFGLPDHGQDICTRSTYSTN